MKIFKLSNWLEKNHPTCIQASLSTPGYVSWLGFFRPLTTTLKLQEITVAGNPLPSGRQPSFQDLHRFCNQQCDCASTRTQNVHARHQHTTPLLPRTMALSRLQCKLQVVLVTYSKRCVHHNRNPTLNHESCNSESDSARVMPEIAGTLVYQHVCVLSPAAINGSSVTPHSKARRGA